MDRAGRWGLGVGREGRQRSGPPHSFSQPTSSFSARAPRPHRESPQPAPPFCSHSPLFSSSFRLPGPPFFSRSKLRAATATALLVAWALRAELAAQFGHRVAAASQAVSETAKQAATNAGLLDKPEP